MGKSLPPGRGWQPPGSEQLRRAFARCARSVSSECQSRVMDSRKKCSCQGFPALARGNNFTVHTVSRHPCGAQARCAVAGRELRAGQRHMGVSWKAGRATPGSSRQDRKRTTPGQQRPGARVGLVGTRASETRPAARAPADEGNRSGRMDGGGSLSRLIVALESRRTEAGGNL